jgi:pimeloyl-ACP methyl ester carboxylesterase
LFREQEIDWLFGKSVQNERKKLCIADYDELSKEWDTLESLAIDDVPKVKSKRHVLHAYYQMLFSDDPILRALAAKHWLRWEGVVSSLNVSTVPNLKTDIDLDSIAVWEPLSREWLLSKTLGDVERRTVISNSFVDSLRRWDSKAKPLKRTMSDSHPRPLESIPLNDKLMKMIESANVSIAQAKEFIPIQAMLTCYYSVNQDVVMDGVNILCEERIDKIRHIPCIAIQGAQDLICPIDSALDLHEVWPEMELHIVGNGKHSMYDPPLTAQLIKATDRFARQPKDCFE